MRYMKLVVLVFLLAGCSLSYVKKNNGDSEYAFRMMQMSYLENHASAQSTVGIGFSLRFTDHSGAVTPKLDLGYFRHATGLDPIIFSKEKRLGSMVISTAADVTGDGITDDVAFGEAALVEHHEKTATPSMFELMIAELSKMKESANGVEKLKYENTIEFLKTVLGGK